MITIDEICEKYGITRERIDSMGGEAWDKLDEAMFWDDWELIDKLLEFI